MRFAAQGHVRSLPVVTHRLVAAEALYPAAHVTCALRTVMVAPLGRSTLMVLREKKGRDA